MRSFAVRFFEISLVVVCLSFLGHGQANAQWAQANGPSGGNVRAFATVGDKTFAGTIGSGVFLSLDDGSSWMSVNSGLKNLYVTSFAVMGTNLFAGTYAGVFFSADGYSWNETGLQLTDVLALTAKGNNLFAGTNEGVYLSANKGVSWTSMNSGLTFPIVTSFAINGDNLFAGTGGGVFLSTDSATSWTSVNAGLTIPDISSLAVSGGNLFAATMGAVCFALRIMEQPGQRLAMIL